MSLWRWTNLYRWYRGVPPSPRAESEWSITSNYISKRVDCNNWYMCRQFKLIRPFSFTTGSVPNLTWKKTARLWQLSRSVRCKSGALAHIPLTPALLMHKISKPRPFSDFEYLSGNETIFLSEKYFLLKFDPLRICTITISWSWSPNYTSKIRF